MIELDVSLTKDSEVIVYHDLEVFDPVTNLAQPIQRIKYHDLIAHDYQHDYIPVRREFFAFFIQICSRSFTNTFIIRTTPR